jgi:fucose permease
MTIPSLHALAGGWIYTYSVRQAGLGPATSHGINAAYWASFTGGRLVASAAAVKLSPAALLGASLPLAVVGAAAALLMPSGSLGAGGGLLYVISALVGLGAAPGFANALALLDSFLPASGTVTGMLSTVAGAGVMTVPLAVALLSQPRFGLQYRSLMVVSLLSFVGQLVLVPFALHAGRCLGVVGRLHTHTRGENDARRYQVQDEGLRASLLGGDGTTAECC